MRLSSILPALIHLFTIAVYCNVPVASQTPTTPSNIPEFFNELQHNHQHEILNFNNSQLWKQEGQLPDLNDTMFTNNGNDANSLLATSIQPYRTTDDVEGFLAPRNSGSDQIVKTADALPDFERWRESQPAGRLLWPKGPSEFYEVPYVVKDGDFSPWVVDEMILWGMKNIERGSNIRFRRATPLDKNFIVFLNGEGCLSIVGRHPQPRPQRISLNVPGCMHRHAVLHELLHSLGFYHEHQRVDADDYIEIAPNAPSSWNQYVERDMTIPTHLTPYNLASIMHYNIYLRAKNPAYQSVLDTRGATLSSCDWHHLNLLYPGPMLPPPCVPHTRVKACEPLPTCPYGLNLCNYMCDIDCDAGLPRGDVPDVVAAPSEFCQYVRGARFPPLPETLQHQVDVLRLKSV